MGIADYRHNGNAQCKQFIEGLWDYIFHVMGLTGSFFASMAKPG
jgi:hypothetical protein